MPRLEDIEEPLPPKLRALLDIRFELARIATVMEKTERDAKVRRNELKATPTVHTYRKFGKGSTDDYSTPYSKPKRKWWHWMRSMW